VSARCDRALSGSELAPEAKLNTARTAARARPNARRYITPIRHIVMPCHINRAAEARYGDTIATFLARTKWAKRIGKMWSFDLPTICVVNGQPVLQRLWRRFHIKSNDVVEFWSRPYGKSVSGKQVAGLVALLALAVFAPYVAAHFIDRGAPAYATVRRGDIEAPNFARSFFAAEDSCKLPFLSSPARLDQADALHYRVTLQCRATQGVR